MFCITLKDHFLRPKFYFCLNVLKVDNSFHIHSENDSMPYFFCLYALFYRLNPLAWTDNLFTGSIRMGSGDKPILTLKILVRNVFRFQHLVNFDIQIVLLGQNSFERIASCWVKYLKPILKLYSYLSLSLALDYFSTI